MSISIRNERELDTPPPPRPISIVADPPEEQLILHHPSLHVNEAACKANLVKLTALQRSHFLAFKKLLRARNDGRFRLQITSNRVNELVNLHRQIFQMYAIVVAEEQREGERVANEAMEHEILQLEQLDYPGVANNNLDPNGFVEHGDNEIREDNPEIIINNGQAVNLAVQAEQPQMAQNFPVQFERRLQNYDGNNVIYQANYRDQMRANRNYNGYRQDNFGGQYARIGPPDAEMHQPFAIAPFHERVQFQNILGVPLIQQPNYHRRQI